MTNLFSSAHDPIFEHHRMMSVKLVADDVKTDETPTHQHKRGQLVFPIKGVITNRIKQAIWMVPPQTAVWIPSQTWHSNKLSAGCEVYMLFVDAECIDLPDEVCILSISALVRELIIHLAKKGIGNQADEESERIVDVLLDELPKMPTEQFDFPTPQEPRIKKIADALLANPADRRTVSEWADEVAMSERSLSRLVLKHTGLTFGKWRSQLHVVMALQQLTCGSSVQRVSESLGYESVSAFITFFKKVLGKSPRQYMADK